MLRRREDRGGVRETAALVAAHHGRGELADEQRVLAERLIDAAPAQIARDAEHRRERPVDAGRRDFDGRGARDPLDQVGVPRCRHAELRREDRGALPERVAVDAVLADQQRDPQPRLQRQLAGTQHAFGRRVQDRADVLAQHMVVEVVARVELHHLPDLLFDRHAAEQVRDAVGDRQRLVEIVRDGRGGHAFSWVFVFVRTTVTVSFTFMPFFFMARARSPAERRRGLTYSSMPKLMSERATPIARDAQARRQEPPPLALTERPLGAGPVEDRAPVVGRHRDDADERQRREADDRGRHRADEARGDQRHQVGKHLDRDDAAQRLAVGLGGLDEVAAAQRHRLRAQHPRAPRPADETEHQRR